MLLPSAFACESSQADSFQMPRTRLQASLFSPPSSPPTLSNQIMNSCRILQTLTSLPTPVSAIEASSSHYTTNPVHDDHLPLPQLPTPPMSYAAPPLKLRLRSRVPASSTASGATPPMRIAKRLPPRGLNKRRRAADDDMGRDDESGEEEEEEEERQASDNDHNNDESVSVRRSLSPSPIFLASDSRAPSTSHQKHQEDHTQLPARPSTPKRARIAPEQLPLGLERSDFHNLEVQPPQQPNGPKVLPGTAEAGTTTKNIEHREGDEEWTAEDDRVLVELVLEKLRLSKTEWQDCARNLGKDRHSVHKRWKSLMRSCDVGLKKSSGIRRGKLHHTWK